ncbi:alkanesulfonate monooxygenase [Stachybotrys elegans]|uniref:Alkanesulfonate monooxygenase n=1 Tax=Stachybotrys elegans TaxID=80388 RepID=A0A8K0SDF9_9HYPO|nr:alkanesulfonate monooxygenase [Stachybotrys elegans]
MASPINQGDVAPERKNLILNAFFMNQPSYVAPGIWRHPRNQTWRYNDVQYWVQVAKLLENNFHALFLADVLGAYDVYDGPRNFKPVLAGAAQFPLTYRGLLISAMAAVTNSLSFCITASTTYEAPFSLARRLSTLDHLTNGRVAWNIVTSYLESAARNFGLREQLSHEERYEKADEFLEVCYKLWEGSWMDNAVIRDPATARYTHEHRVRRIDHQGKHFQVAGPHIVEPSKQRTPFLVQAGASKAGKAFAAKHAEAIFLPGMDFAAVRKLVQELRGLAQEEGRDPASIKLLGGLHVVLGATDEEAQKKYEEYLTFADIEGSLALFGGWTGTNLAGILDDADLKFTGPPAMKGMVENWSATIPGTSDLNWTKALGSAKTVADIIETWIDETGIDGFNLSYAVVPDDLEDHAKYLVPELTSRGIFEPPSGEDQSTRGVYLGNRKDRLRDDHPGSQYKWTSREA